MPEGFNGGRLGNAGKKLIRKYSFRKGTKSSDERQKETSQSIPHYYTAQALPLTNTKVLCDLNVVTEIA